MLRLTDQSGATKGGHGQELLARANNDVLLFLPALLNGLFQSDKVIWRDCINGHLADGTNLSAIVLHWRASKPPWTGLIKSILDKAIAREDDIAVIQCLLFAMESGPGNGTPTRDRFFKPALGYLTARKDVRWVRGARFAHKALSFFDAITAEETKLLLENLLEVSRIEFHTERILSQIACKHLSLVWDYLGQRLKGRAGREGKDRYEAFPYQFHGLEKELSKDPKLAISTVRRWYEDDSTLFRFLGGRLLSTAFPKFQIEISDELCELVTNGTGTDAEFVLAVMENRHGEPATHEVLKRIVAKYSEDQSKMSGVRASFDNTGVVAGEFGFVEAVRQKKAAIEAWRTNSRAEVRIFAEKHIRDLELRIAHEQRRAEEEKALRGLRYDEDDDEKKDGS